MKTKLFLLLLALSVLSTQAQSLSIKGRVTDASQEAVIAANVSLWTIDSTLVTGVTSDAQGKFALPKIMAGDYRLSISFIGLQSENILLKLNKSLDLGDVQLQEDAVSLGEVTVSASNVLQRVDRQIILPSESQLKRSFGAYDLLNNLGIARLQVDNLSNSMSVSGGGAVQTRINGIKVTDKEIAAVRAKDVLRVEFIEDPGKQYGDDELGAVVNIILRRRETGGVVNFQLSDSPQDISDIVGTELHKYAVSQEYSTPIQTVNHISRLFIRPPTFRYRITSLRDYSIPQTCVIRITRLLAIKPEAVSLSL